MRSKSYTIIYQAAKLGDMPYLLRDFELARQLEAGGTPIGRVYGNSSGALVALAHLSSSGLDARTAPRSRFWAFPTIWRCTLRGERSDL